MKKSGPSFSVVGDQKSYGGKTSSSIKGTQVKFNTLKTKVDKIKNLILTKPLLVEYDIFFGLGFQSNLVGYNQSLDTTDEQKSISPRLLNWVEPYEIKGEIKTLFYTEVNSGLKLGDRVFIINGNYDSDILIKKNKYRRGRDGYKVLFIDNCQVVLDIDYTGVLPQNIDSTDDDFVNIYYINSDDDFKWAEKSFTTKNGTFSRKFNYYNNNIIYTDKNYGPLNIWGLNTSIQEAPGFFVRNTSDTFGLDRSLDIGTGFSKEVKTILSFNNHLLIGGDFDQYNGLSCSNLCVISENGEYYTAFGSQSVPMSGFNGPINVIKSDSNDKILIGGSFSVYNSNNAKRIFRLNSDGTIDFSFLGSNIITNGEVRDITILQNGKIVVGGSFTGGIKILNSDGSIDTSFTITSGFDGPVNTIVQDPLTNYLKVGGDFLNYESNSAKRIAELDLSGTFDPSGVFNTNLGSGFDGKINQIIYTSNNQMIVVGNFETFNGVYNVKIIGLNSDGTIDTSLSTGTGFDNEIKSISKRPDGKLFIGGSFTEYNGISAKRIVRLKSNGEIDETFETGFGIDDTVNSVCLTSNDSVYLGGKFTTYNNLSSKGLVKLGIVPWVSITHKMSYGSFSYAENPNLIKSSIKIFNDSFTFSINGELIDFKEGDVYKWDMSEEPNGVRGSFSTWVTDVTCSNPILTKTNFRDGDFKGIWNTGLFGRQNKKITWKGDKSTWNTGTILNSVWEQGIIKSKYTFNENYFTEFDEFGLPSQKLSGPNNNGKGFNFIIDSYIKRVIIENGTIINSKLNGYDSTFSIIENVLSQTGSSSIEVKTAYFENSEINNSIIKNSEVRNIKSNNSSFENVKSINSNFKRSYIKNSDYISDEIIKINNYDEFNISEYYNVPGASHKVYKFYIDEKSYHRLKLNDSFYIKGLRIKNNDKELINLFDKKFKIGSWTEYIDSLNENLSNTPIQGESYLVPNDSFFKRGIDIGAFLSTPVDNNYTYNTLVDGLTYSTTIVSDNLKKSHSIDIVISLRDKDFNTISGLDINTYNNPIVNGSTVSNLQFNSINGLDNVEIKDAYIIDSDFESGLFERSNWNSGHLISPNNDTNITENSISGGFYNLSIVEGTSSIIANTTFNKNWREREEDFLSVGDIVYLNSVSYDTRGKIDTFTISSTGTGYSNGVNSLLGSNGKNAEIEIITGISGEITSAQIVNGGVGYQNGDVLQISGGSSGELTVLSITGSINTIPDTWKISQKINNIITLSEIYSTSSQISNLLPDGIFYTENSQNRWGHLHTVKFKKSLIKKGFLQRVYLNNNLLQNNDLDLTDKDFLNSNQFRTLLFSDILFVNNKNILSKASYLHSQFSEDKNGVSNPNLLEYKKDRWQDGLFFNSVWNSGNFERGLIKDSSWHDGIFISGLFYESRSFNGIPDSTYTQYDTDRIKTYWKSGYTSATISNDRYSWRGGIFKSGEFIKSDWENGFFTSGRFYNSKWYAGTFSSGIIGDSSLSLTDTWFYNGTIKSAVVENANLYSIDTSWFGLSSSNIIWETGIFNSGVFGCDIIIQKTASHTALWKSGTFNGGEFQTNGKWLDGTFNNGKFISGFGWTYSPDINNISSSQSQFTWEDGVFNGGEFGTSNRATNSTWWTGEFNGGEFQGRIWNNGVFTNGDFIGGSTYSAIGGYDINDMSYSNANDFTISFNQDFWGIFRDGIVTSVKDEFVFDKKIFTIKQRSILSKTPPISVNFKNMLWQNGTFTHPGGKMENSIWLDGSFIKGGFKNSSFNPFAQRQGPVSDFTFNINDDLINGSGSCIWYNGVLEDSDFYISQWNSGTFISGTAFGMVWKNGISQYMNAYNVFWENGLWRNGNWFGSFINLNSDGSVTNEFHKQLLLRGMNLSGTSSSHVWNLFNGDSTEYTQMGTVSATSSIIVESIISNIVNTPISGGDD